MMKELIVSGITGIVFATIGTAPALIVALLVYISLRLVKTALTPPLATPPETSLCETTDIRCMIIDAEQPNDGTSELYRRAKHIHYG